MTDSVAETIEVVRVSGRRSTGSFGSGRTAVARARLSARMKARQPSSAGRRARNRGVPARTRATQPSSARCRRRAKTTTSVALALLGARTKWCRRPSATAPTARTSARRPAIFATSPTLHLRRHYPHDKQGWWERGVCGCCDVHLLTHLRPDPRSSGVGLYI